MSENNINLPNVVPVYHHKGSSIGSGITPFLIILTTMISCVIALILFPFFPVVSIGVIGFLILLLISHVATMYPTMMILGVMFTAVIPYAFNSLEIFDEDFLKIGGVLQYVDVFLIAMIGALVIKFFFIKSEAQISTKWKIKIWLLLFALVLLFGVVRNIGAYGLSAPGEFRFRYLILVLPVYIAVFFVTPFQRKRLMFILIFFSTIGTMICVPFIGLIKGWGIGPDDRFLPASLSMSLFQGIIALFLVQKYKLIRINIIFFWILLVPIVVLMIVDSHRSAWLSSFVILMILVLRGEFSIRKAVLMLMPLTVLLMFVLFVFNSANLDLVDYLVERGSAYINPENDNTSSWRLFLWVALLQKFSSQPFLGEGFGGYWEVFVPELGQTLDVQPHNLYIQTLVKIGVAGLSLYLIILLKTWKKFREWLYSSSKSHPEFVIVLVSYTYLVSSHVYYFVYSHDYYTLFFIGLGAAVVRKET